LECGLTELAVTGKAFNELALQNWQNERVAIVHTLICSIHS